MKRESRRHRHTAIATGLLLGGSLALPAKAAELSGRVSDVSGVKSLQSAEIELLPLGRRTLSGADGSFRFSDIPAGRFTLKARYSGAETVELPVTVDADGVTRLDIKLGSSRDGDDMATILVVGQRANQASALSRQRAADGVESVLTRDAIGQFPDQNVAESLRRVPGLSVQNDQGEGRFIVLRGLDPRLNAVSVNGARVPSPESDSRALPLDTISSDQIESIEVKKTLTPDMDGDTLGGSVEIKTASAFDRTGAFVGGTVEGAYNDQTGRHSPKGSLNFSDIYADGKLGVAGGVSYYDRRFGSEGVEASDWTISDDDVAYAEELDYRNYDVERRRISGSLTLDYKASQETALYLRGLLSSFRDQEERSRLVLGFNEAPRVGDAQSATFASDDGEIQAEREMKDRTETQDVHSLVAGGKTYHQAWTFDYALSQSRASEKETGRLDTNFERSFEDPGELQLTVDGTASLRPRFAVSDQVLFVNPAEYEFDKFELTNGRSTDEEQALRVDIARAFSLERGTAEIKFGGKYRQRDKQYDLQLDVYDDVSSGDRPTLAGFSTGVPYAPGLINPTVSAAAAREFFNANRDTLELSTADTALESNAADYDVSEDITAGYVMGRYDARPWRIIGGVRVERTDNDIRGQQVDLVEEGGTRDGVELDEDTVFVTPRSRSRSYTTVLPSLNLRYEAGDDLVLRAAAYRSLVRPDIADLAPRFLIEEADNGGREGEFGNPDLKPYTAWNYDLSAEWYFAPNAVVQVGPFAKRIDDVILQTRIEDTTFNGIAVDEAVLPVNGAHATLLGVELNYQQSMDFLPAPFNGLLVGVNYTYADTQTDYNGREIMLPATSRHVGNLVLGYERGPVSLRLAAARRSEYLDEVTEDGEGDRWVLSHLQYDLTARYRITPRLQVFAEGINLADQPLRAVFRGTEAGGDRLSQFEEYSWTAKLGLRFTFAEGGI